MMFCSLETEGSEITKRADTPIDLSRLNQSPVPHPRPRASCVFCDGIQLIHIAKVDRTYALE